jgi:hypothetical protein
MIGRSEIVGTPATRLPQQRFVTIVGPGGMGKTTVALTAADKLGPSYQHGACFVDLASMTDPPLVPSMLASVLGLEVLSDDPVPALLAFLGDKHLLIVLDNCEHVVVAAAALAEQLLRGAAGRPRPCDQPRAASHRRRVSAPSSAAGASTFIGHVDCRGGPGISSHRAVRRARHGEPGQFRAQ